VRGRARRFLARFVMVLGISACFTRGSRGLLGGSQRRWNLDAEARQRFFGLLPPVGAAESLRSNRVPAPRFVFVFGFFFDRAELPRNHCVARALVKLVEFRLRVGAVLRLANARLDLPPISHVATL
jgi:hypothetical protein